MLAFSGVRKICTSDSFRQDSPHIESVAVFVKQRHSWTLLIQVLNQEYLYNITFSLIAFHGVFAFGKLSPRATIQSVLCIVASALSAASKWWFKNEREMVWWTEGRHFVSVNTVWPDHGWRTVGFTCDSLQFCFPYARVATGLSSRPDDIVQRLRRSLPWT